MALTTTALHNTKNPIMMMQIQRRMIAHVPQIAHAGQSNTPHRVIAAVPAANITNTNRNSSNNDAL